VGDGVKMNRMHTRDSTFYETLKPGPGFPGYEIFSALFSFIGTGAMFFRKSSDGTKLSIA
jgi:hypothetical protein